MVQSKTDIEGFSFYSEYFEQLLNGFDFPLAIFNQKYELIKCNGSFKNLIGYYFKNHKVTFDDLFNNLFADRKEDIVQTLNQNEKIGFDHYFEQFDKWYYISFDFSQPDFNGFKFYYLKFFETTRYKRFEEKLKNSEARYRNLVEQSNDAIIIFNQKEVFFTNKKCWDLTGYNKNDLEGKQLIDIIHPNDKEFVIDIWKERMQMKRISSVREIRLVGAKGNILYVETMASLIKYNGQNAIMVSVRDISKRKKAQVALQESEERYRTLTEQSHDLIIIYQDGKLVYANKKTFEVFEFVEIDFDNLDFFEYIHPYDRKIVDEILNIINSGGEFAKPLGLRVMSKNGNVFHIEAKATSIIYNQKPALLITARDITERKEVEEKFIQTYFELEKSEKEKSLSHFAIDNASEFIFLINSNGGFVRINDKVIDFTKKKKEELIGEHLSILFPDFTKPKWKKFFNDISYKSIENKESFILKNDFERLPVEINANAINYDNIQYAILFVRDVTFRKEAENKIEEHLAEIEELKNRLEAENLYLMDEIKLSHNFEEIITQSNKFKKILLNVESVAATDSTVLITGETGTGKELLARAIHNISHRRERPLVKVNCAALPGSLIESELFGYEKGAFTGALSLKIGRFELADGGTIFLDEIGELPIELQSKLLRVLQDGEFERLGNPRTLKVNVRVIAATNRDLMKEIREKRFRPDLFYRLNVFPIHNPSLSERKEDIPLLVNHFIKKYCVKHGKSIKSIPQKSMMALTTYNWPGNIRELENIIERAIIVSKNEELSIGDWLSPNSELSFDRSLKSLAEFERDYILSVLEASSWRIRGENGAAEILNLKPTTLEAKMKKLKIIRKTPK